MWINICLLELEKVLMGFYTLKIPQRNIIGVIIVNVEHWHKNWGQAAKDPVFWFIAQSKKASLGRRKNRWVAFHFLQEKKRSCEWASYKKRKLLVKCQILLVKLDVCKSVINQHFFHFLVTLLSKSGKMF